VPLEDLTDRAGEVHVHDVKAAFLQLDGRLGHDGRIVADDCPLTGWSGLSRCDKPIPQPPGQEELAVEHHLGGAEGRPQNRAQQPVGQIGVSRQRCRMAGGSIRIVPIFRAGNSDAIRVILRMTGEASQRKLNYVASISFTSHILQVNFELRVSNSRVRI